MYLYIFIPATGRPRQEYPVAFLFPSPSDTQQTKTPSVETSGVYNLSSESLVTAFKGMLSA